MEDAKNQKWRWEYLGYPTLVLRDGNVAPTEPPFWWDFINKRRK